MTRTGPCPPHLLRCSYGSSSAPCSIGFTDKACCTQPTTFPRFERTVLFQRPSPSYGSPSTCTLGFTDEARCTQPTTFSRFGRAVQFRRSSRSKQLGDGSSPRCRRTTSCGTASRLPISCCAPLSTLDGGLNDQLSSCHWCTGLFRCFSA